MADEITICKLDHDGRETWRYTGRIIEQGATWVKIEAYFNRLDSDAGYVVFRQGDRFVEWFYTDRWYNIFEIHDVADDHLKGYYCNITHPAIIEANKIGWPDLALDVWIDPKGNIQLLDEGDFTALPIDEVTRANAHHAVKELRAHIARREAPFERLSSVT